MSTPALWSIWALARQRAMAAARIGGGSSANSWLYKSGVCFRSSLPLLHMFLDCWVLLHLISIASKIFIIAKNV